MVEPRTVQSRLAEDILNLLVEFRDDIVMDHNELIERAKDVIGDYGIDPDSLGVEGLEPTDLVWDAEPTDREGDEWDEEDGDARDTTTEPMDEDDPFELL